MTIRDLVETGKIKAVIDKTFPLEETAEARSHMESGKHRGYVVIRVDHPKK